jgi:hypothetical protein
MDWFPFFRAERPTRKNQSLILVTYDVDMTFLICAFFKRHFDVILTSKKIATRSGWLERHAAPPPRTTATSLVHSNTSPLLTAADPTHPIPSSRARSLVPSNPIHPVVYLPQSSRSGENNDAETASETAAAAAGPETKAD